MGEVLAGERRTDWIVGTNWLVGPNSKVKPRSSRGGPDRTAARSPKLHSSPPWRSPQVCPRLAWPTPPLKMPKAPACSLGISSEEIWARSFAALLKKWLEGQDLLGIPHPSILEIASRFNSETNPGVSVRARRHQSPPEQEICVLAERIRAEGSMAELCRRERTGASEKLQKLSPNREGYFSALPGKGYHPNTS
jgi:hypothetical protein